MSHLGKCSHEVLTDVHGHWHQLLSVGADNLLHNGGQVIILCLPDDLEKLKSDLPDLWLQILLGEVTLAGEHHLKGDGGLHLDRGLLIVKETVDGQPE